MRNKKILFVIYVGLILSMVLPSATRSKETLAPGVYLYKLSNYKGACYRMTGSGNLPSQANFKKRRITVDNSISSIRLVGISSVAVYTEHNYRGNCQTIARDTPNLAKTSVGNNTISSIKTNARCQMVVQGVTLYDQKDFRGRTVTITGNVQDLGVSKFNNKTASFKLHRIGSIAVFNQTGYRGKCQTFKKDYRSLAGTSIGLNSIKSIKINAECAQHRILTIKNRSAMLLRVKILNENRSEYAGYKQVTAGFSINFNIPLNKKIFCWIEVLTAPDQWSWEKDRNQKIKMTRNKTVTATEGYPGPVHYTFTDS